MKCFQFVVYEDEAGRWRWRMQSRNGRILGDSGQGYEDQSAALAAVERIKVKALASPVKILES